MLQDIGLGKGYLARLSRWVGQAETGPGCGVQKTANTHLGTSYACTRDRRSCEKISKLVEFQYYERRELGPYVEYI